MFNSECNFENAGSFIPERWLASESQLKGDPQAFMPFSHGPRNCLGRSLAAAEIRIILAKILWSFDITNGGPDYKWEEQLTFVMWEKNPLLVYIAAVKR